MASATSPSPHEIDQITQITQNLVQALEESEPSKVKMHFTELLGKVGAKKTSILKECIDNFEYEKAISELENMIQEIDKHTYH